ncbi:phospholipase [Pseudomonas simiae]|uniref:phospholipase D-like domain-containing protein n=2 Tax=Pseudomonas simiae TaxID=321846 RepID=UPI0018E8ED41|nr:phospholipase D-like domain-containing protein [Pseudomonas simiae]MBJ2228486.1 phospholipase [Pseudomonas simiae]
MSHCSIVVPIALKHTNEGVCTAPWFVPDAEYSATMTNYEPLINGEAAFRSVYKAIEAAEKSIDIVCWGFQPSMYFIRDGAHTSIGILLQQKARLGIQVRVLAWEMPKNSAGLGGEANLPGKGGISDRSGQTATDDQHAYDELWFKAFSVEGKKAIQRVLERVPVLVTRGFSVGERNQIRKDVNNGLDREVSWAAKNAMMAAPSHHQKSVLIDYELPDKAIGFVMGHNMLDEYWDTDTHSALRRPDPKKPNFSPFTHNPDRGPRGVLPRQDISCRVSGPILEYLHQNFAEAWQKETGENLLALRNAKEIGKFFKCSPGDPGTRLLAQLLRTQGGRHDIEKAYLQAVNNATQFIYIENQYFRWPPLAELINKVAATQTAKGRDPGKHGALHLFVTTNVSDGGIGLGVVNTQRMLESLGRADTIPNVTLLRRIDQEKREMPPEPRVTDPRDTRGLRERELWQQELDRRTKRLKEDIKIPENRPGLKIHVCSLVASDSPAGKPWMPVYIHSKLMIVNDVYTIQGSANINTRSMRVDSELNLAHEWHPVTRKMRRKLWNIHTAGVGAQDDAEEAFDKWQDIINKNKTFQSKEMKPCASIIEFHYDKFSRSDLD